jgi:hypothetical protein
MTTMPTHDTPTKSRPHVTSMTAYLSRRRATTAVIASSTRIASALTRIPIRGERKRGRVHGRHSVGPWPGIPWRSGYPCEPCRSTRSPITVCRGRSPARRRGVQRRSGARRASTSPCLRARRVPWPWAAGPATCVTDPDGAPRRPRLGTHLAHRRPTASSPPSRPTPAAQRSVPSSVAQALVGWRTGLWRTIREDVEQGSDLHQLLDDLPGGYVISGFTRGRARAASGSERPTPVAGSPARRLRRLGSRLPRRAHPGRRPAARPGRSPPGAPLPIDHADDARGWHTWPALRPWGISRRRRIDAWRDADTSQSDPRSTPTSATVSSTTRAPNASCTNTRSRPRSVAARHTPWLP